MIVRLSSIKPYLLQALSCTGQILKTRYGISPAYILLVRVNWSPADTAKGDGPDAESLFMKDRNYRS